MQQHVQRPLSDAEPETPIAAPMGVSADKRGALRSAMGSLLKEALTGTVKNNNDDRECRTSRIGQHHGVEGHWSCA